MTTMSTDPRLRFEEKTNKFMNGEEGSELENRGEGSARRRTKQLVIEKNVF